MCLQPYCLQHLFLVVPLERDRLFAERPGAAGVIGFQPRWGDCSSLFCNRTEVLAAHPVGGNCHDR
jgi:hypothetical protein